MEKFSQIITVENGSIMGNNPKQILAIIPARGGSKSIPRKNIKLFGNFPLLAYSISAALKSRTVDRVIVSTDDEEIADIARENGAETPFLRPAEFSQDDTLDFPVFEHALEWFQQNEKWYPDVVVHLRPTTPIRPLSCVDDGVGLLLETPGADSVRSLVPSRQTPFKMWKIDGDFIVPIIKSKYDEPYNMPRQKLPSTYTHSGHVDVIRATTITNKKSLTGDKILPLFLDSRFTVDIDDPEDWEYAEWMLKRMKKQIVLPEPRNMPDKKLDRLEMIVFDFDGVFTDNKVLVNQDGSEAVLCDRGDGMGISMLKKHGIQLAVLSTEENPVVSARCRKLDIQCCQGLVKKEDALRTLISDKSLKSSNVAFVGNDLNDAGCFRVAGVSIAVSDAHPDLLKSADIVLERSGGKGAVRELTEMILNAKEILWEIP